MKFGSKLFKFKNVIFFLNTYVQKCLLLIKNESVFRVLFIQILFIVLGFGIVHIVKHLK